MSLELKSIRNAVESLERSINVALRKQNDPNVDIDEKDTIRAGVIQNFEFTYEQCWKFMKRWHEENINPESVDGITRKELFRLSAENKLIEDVEKWMEFHRARNITSHTYDGNTANEVFHKTVEFLPFAKAFLVRLDKVK